MQSHIKMIRRFLCILGDALAIIPPGDSDRVVVLDDASRKAGAPGRSRIIGLEKPEA
jgi:hypothetical protein